MPTGSDISFGRRPIASKSPADEAVHREPPFAMRGAHDGRRLKLPTILWAAGAIGIASVGALVYFFLDPTRVTIFPPCLFHQLTGLDCPGCGAQRALHQLLHGHLVSAIRLNAMFVLSIPIFAWMGTRFLVRNFRGVPADFRFKWWWAYLAAWIVFGVMRNLPFAICQWFAA